MSKRFKWENDDAMNRVDAVRRRLIDMGFRSLSAGDFGLPSYDKIEAWGTPIGCRTGVVYLLYSKNGGWDILRQIDTSNEVEAAFAELDKLAKDVTFPKRLENWLAKNKQAPETDPLEYAIGRAKAEVLEDVGDGTLPEDVKTFGELHDHVDANAYGGAFEVDFDESDACLNFWNKVQNAVHEWLASGEMLKEYRAKQETAVAK